MLFISGKDSFTNIVIVTYPDGDWKRYDWIANWIPEADSIFTDLKGEWVISKVDTWGWDYFEIQVIPFKEEDEDTGG